MANLKWDSSVRVCVAVYVTLEDDKGLNQIDQDLHPFDMAGGEKMSVLLIYLLTAAASETVREQAITRVAITFTRNLITTYKAKYKVGGLSYEIIRDNVIKIFKDKDKTLNDLATYLDNVLVITN